MEELTAKKAWNSELLKSQLTQLGLMWEEILKLTLNLKNTYRDGNIAEHHVTDCAEVL